MIQSMQLHDVFYRLLWFDGYANNMHYSCGDGIWFKVIWQLLARVIPTYSVQMQLGGLAWLDSHSLFHVFGISFWGLLAEIENYQLYGAPSVNLQSLDKQTGFGWHCYVGGCFRLVRGP
jgi:hypothetical protein